MALRKRGARRLWIFIGFVAREETLLDLLERREAGAMDAALG
jgi:hypothetical protein